MALPGVTTILKDRFYSLSRTDIPAGPKVLAIAARTTANGTGGIQDLDPYQATNEKTVITAFGEGSPAHRAYLELVSGGAARPYIVALPSGTLDSDLVATGNGNVFDAAFDAAETELPDIIVPWGRGGHPSEWESPATPNNAPQFGFCADNTASAATSLVKRVADKCQVISERSHPCFAVMGIKPWSTADHATPGYDVSESLTAAQVAEHLTLPTLLSKESATFETVVGSDSVHNGMYVSVIATELKTVGYPAAFGYSNGACEYAGYISTLRSWSAPTGKVAYNVSGLRWTPTRPQQEALITKGIVPVALDFNRSPLWVDAITYGKAGSDYSRLSTLRIVFDVILLVRNVSQGFIGEGATLAQRNALETAIAAGLRGMQIIGALITSDFNITYVPSQNKAIVDLVINPAFEMRNVEISVSVQL